MFEFLFRNTKRPRPIFEALGTDMHCHLLPMVDDGSKALEETLLCLQTLKDVGYKRVFLTPHFQPPRFPNREDDIVRRYEELKRQVDQAGIGIELAGIGGEYRLDPDFIERNQGVRFLSIDADSSMDKGYMLVELSLQHRFPGMIEVISELQQQGYVVVMAHPERYPYLNMSGSSMERLKEMGVLMQVNVLSLDGFYGDVVRRKGEELISRGWVEMLGTDAHNQLYAQALVRASNNHKIERIISKNNFLNIDL